MAKSFISAEFGGALFGAAVVVASITGVLAVADDTRVPDGSAVLMADVSADGDVPAIRALWASALEGCAIMVAVTVTPGLSQDDFII